MKKIYFSLLGICLSMVTFSQCYTYQVPTTTYNTVNSDCYNDALTVGINSISANNGYQATGNSYQSFPLSFINVQIGENYYCELIGSSIGNYDMGIWIDYNGNQIFEQIEQVYLINNSSYNIQGFYLNIPLDAVIDTVDMRIVKLLSFGAWGTGMDDACNIASVGEVEDYKVIINCANFDILNFDPNPWLCYNSQIELSAFPQYGDVSWYTDTNLAPVYTGNYFNLLIAPSTTDTIIYVQNTFGTCFNGPKYQMHVQIISIPQVVIDSPDTVHSCTAYTFNATPGFDSYYWSWGNGNEGFDPFVEITSGAGGFLTLTATLAGCFSFDQVLISIAPDPVSNYAHFYKSNDFCNDHTFMLLYDSIISPGICSWYLMPSNTLIGSGSNVSYMAPSVGNYQVEARINTICGIDTAHFILDYLPDPTYDSLTFPDGHLNNSGIYEVCYNGNSLIVSCMGLSGVVYSWNGSLDGVNWYSLNNGLDSLSIPGNMVSPGNNFYVFAQITNSNGCIFNTDTLIFTPYNTLALNLPDNYTLCNFPDYFGIPAVNYSRYDLLWNTGDTINNIYINTEGLYTLTTNDNYTGCMNQDHVYITNGSNISILPSTTYSCSSNVNLFNDNAISWTEYDDSWGYINQSADMFYSFNWQGFNEYIVVEANVNGCNIIDTTYVNFNGNFTFDLGNDITVYSSSYTLNAPSDFQNGYYSLIWNPGSVGALTYNVTLSGQYMLTIDNGQGCVYTDTINVTLLPNNIQLNSVSGHIIVFPNPATNNLNFVSEISFITEIKISDLTGRVVFNERVDNLAKVSLDISNLPDGYYFSETTTNKGKLVNKIIISKE